MTKRSQFEQAQRAAEDQRMREIGAAWTARLTPQEAAAFRAAVEQAHQRPPVVHEDMAPGTRPNPPRPGREPRPVDSAPRRRG